MTNTRDYYNDKASITVEDNKGQHWTQKAEQSIANSYPPTMRGWTDFGETLHDNDSRDEEAVA